MAITINIHYFGEGDHARLFAEEMLQEGIVDKIKEEPGNLKYEYYIPLKQGQEIMLIDSWENQEALDVHHASPMMGDILRLREKYGLSMKVERFVSADDDITENDKKFIK